MLRTIGILAYETLTYVVLDKDLVLFSTESIVFEIGRARASHHFWDNSGISLRKPFSVVKLVNYLPMMLPNHVSIMA